VAPKRYQTSKRTWIAVSLVLFFAAWFLHVGKGDGQPLWSFWQEFVADPSALLPALIIFTVAFLVPAVILGWVIQCFIVMASSSFKRRRSHLT
jgi:hypothetical protein